MLTDIKSLDIELSIKVGDYVGDNGDGNLFSQNMRLKYLERAYNKTIRLLSLAMDKYAPEFARRYYTKLFMKSDIKNSEIEFTEGYSVIEQVTVSVIIPGGNGKAETISAMKSDNDIYLTTKAGLNTQRKPSLENKLVYYSIVNNKIVLLPQVEYQSCEILYKKDGEKISSINDKIPLETNYTDLILSFAAAEAMVDLGRGDKANAFYDDAYSQVKLLQQIALVKKREAGNS